MTKDLIYPGGEYITAVAIQNKEGVVIGSLPPPNRHEDVIKMLEKDGIDPSGTKGFYTSRDRFVDRKEAARIAMSVGQVKKQIYDGIPFERKDISELFSEDLW